MAARGTIKLTEKSTRKAGGIDTTPRYIVDYIVERTIGEQLKGKTPREIRKFRALDPACGSGSFLIRVFDRLCEAHAKWYSANPNRHTDELCYIDEQGNLQLYDTFKERDSPE